MVTSIFKETSERHADIVIEAVQNKIGQQLRCPVSQDVNWEVQRYPAILPAADQFGASEQTLMEMRLSYAMATVICRTCGYSMMFNLFALGVGEELGLVPFQEGN